MHGFGIKLDVNLHENKISNSINSYCYAHQICTGSYYPNYCACLTGAALTLGPSKSECSLLPTVSGTRLFNLHIRKSNYERNRILSFMSGLTSDYSISLRSSSCLKYMSVEWGQKQSSIRNLDPCLFSSVRQRSTLVTPTRKALRFTTSTALTPAF